MEKKILEMLIQRPIDLCAFTGLFSVSIVTYLYGAFEILPQLLIGLPSILMWFCWGVGTWVLTAVLSNLYLIRYKNSTIVNRMLINPTIEISSDTNKVSRNKDCIINTEQTNLTGQHTMPKEENWHVCATCQVFVPPRTWHCLKCNVCVLRRDHHCMFSMCCVGEQNHSNFLSLLLYLSLGSTIASVLDIIYVIMYTNFSIWIFILKSGIPAYTLLFDFSVLNLLFCINFVGTLASWVMFVYQVMLATKNQTSFEKRNEHLTSKNLKSTYSNLEKFIGKKPVLRILWPFHSPLKSQYGSSDHLETCKDL